MRRPRRCFPAVAGCAPCASSWLRTASAGRCPRRRPPRRWPTGWRRGRARRRGRPRAAVRRRPGLRRRARDGAARRRAARGARSRTRSRGRSRRRCCCDGGTAYVERAQACGLHLLTAGRARPARDHDVRRRPAAARRARRRARPASSSGSAAAPPTTAAPGMLAALGLRRASTRRASRCAPGGAALRGLDRLAGRARPAAGRRRAGRRHRRRQPAARAVRRDRRSSARRRAPRRDDVALLDGALTRWADVLEAHLGVAVRDRPGAGAAGGLGAALLALGATQRARASRWCSEAVGLDARGRGRRPRRHRRGPLRRARRSSARSSAGVRRGGRRARACPASCWPAQVQLGRREAAAAGVEQAYVARRPGRAGARAGRRRTRRWPSSPRTSPGSGRAGRRGAEACASWKGPGPRRVDPGAPHRPQHDTPHGGHMTAPETAVPTADTADADRRRAHRPRRREGQGPARPGGSRRPRPARRRPARRLLGPALPAVLRRALARRRRRAGPTPTAASRSSSTA